MGRKGVRLDELQGKGKMIKYLGVWFEASPGWKKQREAMTQKHKKLTTLLSESNPSVHHAIMALNTKVIPAVTYGASIVPMPRTAVSKFWTNTEKTHF